MFPRRHSRKHSGGNEADGKLSASLQYGGYGNDSTTNDIVSRLYANFESARYRPEKPFQ